MNSLGLISITHWRHDELNKNAEDKSHTQGINCAQLDLGHFTKTTDGRFCSHCSCCAGLPSTSGDDFAAAATLPDPHVGPLHGVLSAKSKVVLGVLRNLILLHHLTEGSTISGSVLATNACFLCALSHLCVATVCPHVLCVDTTA